MTEIVPVSSFYGLTQCTDIAAQAALAQELLYAIGLTEAENVPPLEAGESLPDYIQRIREEDLAQIEALGIGGGRRMEQALKTAARLILYQQYTSGRWRSYAASLSTDQWSPYVTYVLDDCLNMSEGEGRRWATAIEVIAALYSPLNKKRLGLTFQGDTLVDAETGEQVESNQGLAATAEDTILNGFSRFAREAGVKLRDLLRQIDNLPLVDDWERLVEYQQAGYLDNEGKAAELLGWDHQTYTAYRHLYSAILEVRRILKLAASPHLTNRQVNRQATGDKPVLPPLVLPDDFDPQWAALLESRYPEMVSRTSSLPFGQRMVQIRCTDWPVCANGHVMSITPHKYSCPECGHTVSEGKTTVWEWREADEYGHYPTTWHEGAEPPWRRGTSERMDLFGLSISLWEIAVDLEDLDAVY